MSTTPHQPQTWNQKDPEDEIDVSVGSMILSLGDLVSSTACYRAAPRPAFFSCNQDKLKHLHHLAQAIQCLLLEPFPLICLRDPHLSYKRNVYAQRRNEWRMADLQDSTLVLVGALLAWRG